MNARNVLVAVAIVVGLINGPSSLESAALSEPPLRWPDLAFVFGGCVIALFVALGFQGVIGSSKALRWGWAFFAISSVYAVSAGLSALVVSLSRSQVAPYSFLFLVLGAGMVVGSVLVRRLFSRRFENVA